VHAHKYTARHKNSSMLLGAKQRTQQGSHYGNFSHLFRNECINL